MGKQGTRKARIWVVDDEHDIIDAMRGLLEDAGFEFRGFVDPRAALGALEVDGEPDLLLLDLNMPHVTGLEFLRLMRARQASALTPVVVVTALTSESSVLNAFEAGADDVIRKPASTAELLARINAQLARSDRLTQLRRQNRDLKLLTELAHVFSQETELPEILRTLIDGLRTSLSVQIAAIYLLERGSGDLHRALPAEPTRSEGAPNITLDLRDLQRVADVLAAREPALLGVAETDKLLAAIGGAHPELSEDRSSAIFPMKDRDELVGVIVLAGNRGGLGTQARERFIGSIISSFAAVAVQRAALFNTLRDDHRKLDRTNAELAKTRDFLENVILSSPDAIVASNSDAEIVLYNDAAERILGWKREEAIGADVRLLYPEGGAERIMHRLRSQGYGGKGRLEPMREIVSNKDRREIPVEISAAIIYDEAGDETATVGIFTDLRGRLRMEERLQEATENLERSRRQAVVAELAGAAAHELNQPLTSLLGYAELLGRRIDDDDNRRAVETMQNEAKRIADVVKKIGRLTDYRTKEYVGGARIVDLESASEPEGLENDRRTENVDEESEL